MPVTKYVKDYSDFVGLEAPYTKPDSNRLEAEIDDSAIVTTLKRIETDDDSAKCNIWFNDELSGGDLTILNGIVAAHTGVPLIALMPILLESPLIPIDEGVSAVVANGRPAIEIQPGITAFAGARMRWPEVPEIYTKVCLVAQFILKAAGTGSNIRLALKAKSNATGTDSSAPFSPVGYRVVPVNFVNVGDIFEGVVEFMREDFDEGDAVAIQLGRDGAEQIGDGDPDDVDVAIQIIATTVGVK
jgi:hypothetical protein